MKDPSDLLPRPISEIVLTFPEWRMGASKIAVTMADGSVVEDVMVAWGRQVVRVGDVDGCPFDARQVMGVEDRSQL